ncbi:MAG: hypothetical protein ACHQVS_02330 [Candidatus Babeliales bacterium]
MKKSSAGYNLYLLLIVAGNLLLHSTFSCAIVLAPTYNATKQPWQIVSLATAIDTVSSKPESSFTKAINKEVWVTIFVHGIMSIKPHVSASNFLRFMTDDVRNTVYSKTVEKMRDDPVFYQNQAMQGLGLLPADPTQPSADNAANTMAMVFETMSRFTNPNKNIHNHYYTYGWTGLLSEQQRTQDGTTLYTALVALVENYKANGIEPHIRLIGYSHGGNICLKVAHAALETGHDNHPTIDELVLLGMPVQSETDYLINHAMFKKVYHIYSRGDRIQKLDFFSLDRFFSRRIFKERKDFQLPDKLIQIQLKCTRNTAKGKTMQRAYDFTSPAVIGGKSRYLRDASPGHTELWFFGWTPANYRGHFPLYPLPSSALVPMIVQATNYFDEADLFQKPTLIDIRPEHEIIVIKNQKSQRVLTITKFLSKEEFNALKTEILKYAPAEYTPELYNGRIQVAFQQAKVEKKVERLAKLRRKRSSDIDDVQALQLAVD